MLWHILWLLVSVFYSILPLSTVFHLFKYLGMTLTNQNSIQEEIKSTLKSVQNFLSTNLLTHTKKVYRTITLPVVLYACETWLLILRDESSLRVSENRVLR
jgi:hypothetical protein